MNRLARWIIRQLVSRCGSRTDIGLSLGQDDSGELYLVIDVMGITYLWPKTPDQMREIAWALIGHADSAES